MKKLLALIVAGLVFAAAAPESSAQWFGTKKSKLPPAQRVSELIAALKSDKDGHKRMEAAEELRQFDTKEFPEIIPALAEALHNDPAVSVRIESAVSLGRVRPISTQAGQALEKAAGADSNLRVRLQAKTSLTLYQLSGYHSPKAADAAALAAKTRTDEPPLAGTTKDQGTTNASFKNAATGDKSNAGTILTGSSYNFHRPMPAGPVQAATVPSAAGSPVQADQPAGPTVPMAASPTTPTVTSPQGTWVPLPGTTTEGPSLFPPK
jgi:hypothetical protein